MKYLDADGLWKCFTTCSDQYLGPAYHSLRPTVLGGDGWRIVWIDESLS